MTEQVALSIALFSPLLRFRKSQWNTGLDHTKTAVEFVSAKVTDEQLPEAKWTTLIVDSKFETISADYMISYLLDEIKTAEDIRFNTKNKANGTAYHALRNLEMAAEQQAALDQSSVFLQVIYNVLKIVKPSAL